MDIDILLWIYFEYIQNKLLHCSLENTFYLVISHFIFFILVNTFLMINSSSYFGISGIILFNILIINSAGDIPRLKCVFLI